MKINSKIIAMKKFGLLKALVFSVLIAGFAACSGIYENGKELADVARKNIKEIGVEELKVKIENLEEFLLIDIRQPAEYQAANIPGSFLIPRGVLEFKILDEAFWEEEFMYAPLKEDEIIIYCKAGDRGALAVKSLQQLGFTNVSNLAGGYTAFDPDPNTTAVAESDGGCGG